MSGSKRSVCVSRNYSAAPDDCVRALELLLEKPVSKEGTWPGAPNDGTIKIKEDNSANDILPHQP